MCIALGIGIGIGALLLGGVLATAVIGHLLFTRRN